MQLQVTGGLIGDVAIYDTFARMSQPWINNIPEVDWHGNNGSQYTGPECASARYTEARLSKLAEEGLFKGIKKNNVKMISNYSEDAEWPEVLPAVLPRLMVNGCQGIGSTIANVWLPHSLDDITRVLIKYIKTKELDYFYPTNTLVTGYDIIFFWVVRMVFSGYEQTGKSPFDTVLIHGLVRDEQGRKMSKSLGNGINPLDVIAQYGADALRFTLITGNAPGNDMRYTEKRVIASRNFANKIWNASRFIMMNLEQADFSDVTLEDLTSADKWILSKLNTLAKDVTDNMEKYELGIAVQKLNDFLWEEFCDWYIEMVKPRLYNDEDQTKAAALWTLNTVLTEALKLLHPYMPFITEEIYCNLTDEESIMLAKWPEFKEEWNFKADEKAVETIKEAVRGIRNVRAEMNVSPKKKAQVYVVSEDAEIRDIFEQGKVFFATLGYASEVIIQDNKDGIGDDAVSSVIAGAVIYMPFAELVDIAKEKERLAKEEKRLNGEIKRCEGMLGNERFVSKAPEAKVQEEKDKLAKYQQMLEQVKEQIARIS